MPPLRVPSRPPPRRASLGCAFTSIIGVRAPHGRRGGVGGAHRCTARADSVLSRQVYPGALNRKQRWPLHAGTRGRQPWMLSIAASPVLVPEREPWSSSRHPAIRGGYHSLLLRSIFVVEGKSWWFAAMRRGAVYSACGHQGNGSPTYDAAEELNIIGINGSFTRTDGRRTGDVMQSVHTASRQND